MEAITGFLEDFDFAKLLPEIGKYVSGLRLWINIIMLLGPVVLLAFGLCYFFRPVKTPSEKLGFRIPCVMEDTEAWLYAQKLAGNTFMYLGGALSVVSVVLTLVFLGLDTLTLALCAVLWIGVQTIAVVVCYFSLRSKLNARYDENGKRKKRI